jgi:hypothetical protein
MFTIHNLLTDQPHPEILLKHLAQLFDVMLTDNENSFL